MRSTARPPLDRIYDLVTGDEDARVCKDIPDSACQEQPRNFFAYLAANLLGKIADELSSAKLVLPWMLGALGAPAAFAGYLVPIRESGVLLPQLAVASAIRRRPKRKGVWICGAVISAVVLGGMATAATLLTGPGAGWALLSLLALFSLARGLCSVSAKDVLGKTISKSRRGVLMGWSAALGGVAVLGIGIYLGTLPPDLAAPSLFAGLLGLAALLWIAASGIFGLIKEEPGATEGGGNAFTVARESLAILRRDRPFRNFVLTRLLLLSVALSPPFYVLLGQIRSGNDLGQLGWLIVASGLGASLSSPFWGRLGDRSSRSVMAMASIGHAILALLVFAAVRSGLGFVAEPWFWAGVILLLTVLHSGVRLGRKVYLVDMATTDTRATYVAVSNTVIGVAMLGAGIIGLLGDRIGQEFVILVLGLGSFLAALSARSLPEVSG